MPGNGVKVTYQPFSLQERMAPLAMMKEEYDKVNEGLAELGMTANQVAQYIDPNSEAGRTLAQYNQTLDDAAGTLSREGLKGLSRTALYNLKRAYQSQIAPINEGAKNYFTLQAKIKEMQWKDPTIMVSGMPTLDEYIKNPSALPNLVSGAQLMQEGANAAMTLPGVTYEQLSRYLNGDISAIPDLDKTAQTIANNYGMSTDEAYAYIQRGIMSGLGKRATTWEMTRQEADYKFSQDMAKLRYQAGVSASEAAASRKASRDAAHDRLVANMLLQGFVPDDTAPGGFRRDPELAAQIQSTRGTLKTTGSGSGNSGKASTQYMHRTKGTVGYNPDGTRNKSQDIPSDAVLINDITKASTNEKALALAHAGIPIEDCKKAGGNGYNEDAINNKVQQNLDTLGAYRFWTTSRGSGDKKRVTGFWGTDTAVEREVDNPYYGSLGANLGYSSGYPYGYSESSDLLGGLNGLPDELMGE